MYTTKIQVIFLRVTTNRKCFNEVGEGCWYIRKESTNMEEKIVKIINEMAEYLNVSQMKKLQEVLLKTFSEQEVEKQK